MTLDTVIKLVFLFALLEVVTLGAVYLFGTLAPLLSMLRTQKCPPTTDTSMGGLKDTKESREEMVRRIMSLRRNKETQDTIDINGSEGYPNKKSRGRVLIRSNLGN